MEKRPAQYNVHVRTEGMFDEMTLIPPHFHIPALSDILLGIL